MSDWKRAIKTPIYKKDDKKDPENYDPISLTSMLNHEIKHKIPFTRMSQR